MANTSISDKLYSALTATHIEIIDNSRQHAGHAGVMAKTSAKEGTHLRIIAVSPRFRDIPLLDRHRMVHEILKEDFAGNLHALELKTFTPEEWEK